jgi:hypothetical protein
MASGSPGLGGIAARALVALLLVFATYNPEGVSFYHWAIAPLLGHTPSTGSAPLKFLTGVGLLAGWVVFLNATRRSIGIGGSALVLAMAGGLVWLLVDTGIVSARSARGMTYVVEVCTAILLAVGMSWSHVSRSLSGQMDTDPVD